MKFTRKQKEFEKQHGYTIMTVENKIFRASKDKKPQLASEEEIITFHYFFAPTMKNEIKADFENLEQILRNFHKMFKRWQMKLICQGKSNLNNGRKFYVLEDLNGTYHVVHREGFKLLKTKGLISKKATFLDLSLEAIYVSKTKK